MVKLAALSAGVAIAALVGGMAYMAYGPQNGDQFAACRTSQIAGGAAAIGGPFELVNARGETVTDTDVFTKPSLVYFGFTFCPDVCPMDLARNADAVDLLQEQGVDVTPVFISIDPNRDTPEVVGEYTGYMHPEMIGLTGSEQQVKAASQAYKTYYKRQPGDDEYYLVDHSTFTYLVFPEEGFIEFFRNTTTAESMANSVACFVQNA